MIEFSVDVEGSTGRGASMLDEVARLAFAVMVIVIPFRLRVVLQHRPVPPIYKDFTDLLLYGGDILLLVIVTCWLLSHVMRPRRITPGPIFLTLPVLGLTIVGILTAPFSIDPTLSGFHALRLVLLAGFYFYLINEYQSLRWLFPLFTLQVFIQAVVGIVQIQQQHSVGLQTFGELELDPGWTGVSIVWAEGIRSLRAYGLTDHPNILGGCFALALILLSISIVQLRPLWRSIGGVIFAIGSIGLLLTFSRAAWLGLITGLLLAGTLTFRTQQKEHFWTLVSILLGGILLAVPFIWSNLPYLGIRLTPGESTQTVAAERRSIAERKSLNQAANQIFVDHALSGVGVGASPQALLRHDPQFPFDYQPAHIALLAVAVETGLFGALFYFLLALTPWFALWVNRQKLRYTPSLIGWTGALLAITVIGLFDYYTWLLPAGRQWQWLIWGAWGASYSSSQAREQPAPPPKTANA